MSSIEIIRQPSGVGMRHALFDFDGTISLIRSGWQGVMIPYFTDELLKCPRAEDESSAQAFVTEFVDLLTGKQTIYQCMRLAEAVAERGGSALTPAAYKSEYLRRLSIHTADRLNALKSGADPSRYTVRGAIGMLKALHNRGVCCHLASGTDEVDVRREAALLGVDQYFDGIYGANDAVSLTCSKEVVIEHLLKQNAVKPEELITFGDGYVEIELTHAVSGYAVGVATDETGGSGVDAWKRRRLLDAGADMVIPDFCDAETLIELLYCSVTSET